MSLQDTITKHRKALGLTQKELAIKADLTQATISRLEKGKLKQLQSNSLSRLASALNITVDYLIGKTKDLKPENLFQADSNAQKLLNWYSTLDITNKHSLLLFAEFLAERQK